MRWTMRFFFNRLAIACIFASFCFGTPLHSETISPEKENTSTSSPLPSEQNSQPSPSPSPPFPFPLEPSPTETRKPGEDRFIFDFINMLATLGLLISIILIATWILKRLLNTRLQQMNSSSNIKIVERRALSPKTAIYIIEVNNRNLVVAESVNGITQLTDDYQAADSPQETFEQMVNPPSEKKPSQ